MNHQTPITISCPRCGEKDKCNFISKTQKREIEINKDFTFIDNFEAGHLYHCHACGLDFVLHGNIASSLPKPSYPQKLKEKISGLFADKTEK